MHTILKGSHHLYSQKKIQVPKNEIFHSKNWVSGTLIFFDRILRIADLALSNRPFIWNFDCITILGAFFSHLPKMQQKLIEKFYESDHL